MIIVVLTMTSCSKSFDPNDLLDPTSTMTMLMALLLTNCTYRVQFGKACTPNNSEWSYVWLKEKGEVNISKDNCDKK